MRREVVLVAGGGRCPDRLDTRVIFSAGGPGKDVEQHTMEMGSTDRTRFCAFALLVGHSRSNVIPSSRVTDQWSEGVKACPIETRPSTPVPRGCG